MKHKTSPVRSESSGRNKTNFYSRPPVPSMTDAKSVGKPQFVTFYVKTKFVFMQWNF